MADTSCFIPDMNGSIPACAGEPSLSTGMAAPCRLARVYPRVCGGALGSDRFPRTSDCGSIPACAGEPDPVEAAHDQT